MSKVLNILIIEDDKYTRIELKEILMKFGLVSEAKNLVEAFELINSQTFDLIITDIELEDRSGIEIIPAIVKSKAYCIVVSSYKEDDIIEAAYHLGVKHYLSKSKIRELLPVYVNKFLQEKNQVFDKLIQETFITQNEALIRDLRELCDINWKNKTLFITGSTGTGKSLLGKLVHQITHPNSNLIHINCSEIPENLLESELFGYEKGAFTGADQKKDGKLLLANGGTLFLDEIATMSLGMQQKLLKALDEKTFFPVGASRPLRSEFTLISATCEDLEEKIRKKEFREDLFFRISGHQFHLPELKNRKEDILKLIKYFQIKSPRRFIIKQDALEKLMNYSWPGNIRELEKVCEKMSHVKNGIIDDLLLQNILKQNNLKIEANNFNDIFEVGLRAYIKEIEKKAVLESLQRNQNKISSSIKELKISSSAIYRIIQENNIEL